MQGTNQRTLILEGGRLRLREPNQFISGVRRGGEMGKNCRELGSPRRGGAGVGGDGDGANQRVSMRRGRAARWRARSGLTHLAPVPEDPREGWIGRGKRRKSGGRACAVARGGAGTWLRARRLRASREPGGRRAAGARTMGEKPGTR